MNNQNRLWRWDARVERWVFVRGIYPEESRWAIMEWYRKNFPETHYRVAESAPRKAPRPRRKK